MAHKLLTNPFYVQDGPVYARTVAANKNLLKAAEKGDSACRSHILSESRKLT